MSSSCGSDAEVTILDTSEAINNETQVRHWTTQILKVMKGKHAGKAVKHFKCKYCSKSFQGPGTSTTLKHLRSCHPSKCPELLPAASGAAAISARGFFDKKKMTEPFDCDIFMGKLLKWIIRTDQPFSVVENKDLQDLLDYLRKVL